MRVGPSESGLNDPRDSLSSSSQTRYIGTLTNALAGALGRLSERLDAVSWPVSTPESLAGATGAVFGSRVVSVPAELSGALSASLTSSSSTEERLGSSLRRGGAGSGLAAGTYALALSLGGQSETVSVGIGSGWSARQVFDAVAEAVNGADLAVDASVRTNSSGYFIGRSALVLSADASLAGQEVSLEEVSGATKSGGRGLARWLDLSAENAQDFGQAAASDVPAGLGVTRVTGLATAKPTRYASQGVDAEAATTLAPGSYTLDYLVGPRTVGEGESSSSGSSGEAGSVSIQVSSGDTWGDVLSRMARVLGSASPSMVARLVPAKRVYDLPTGQRGLTDATGLEVLSSTDKSGWRLRLSGADAASEQLLAALGLNTLAEAGSSAQAVIDGQPRQSASGTFSAASGRLSVDVSGTFGEAAPVSVREGPQALASALADVLAAYNEVAGLLTRSAGEVKAEAVDDWTALAADRAGTLGNIGVARASQALWLSEQEFLTALFARPQEVKSALLGADGFLTALKDATDAALAPAAEGDSLNDGQEAGVQSWISASASQRAQESTAASALRSQQARTEAQVEKSNQLLDLYDAASALAPDFSLGAGAGGLLRRRG